MTGSQWHGDRVVEFLARRGKADGSGRGRANRKPFLIYMGFSHPHDPRNAPEDLARKYGASNQGPGKTVNPKSPPLPINYLPAHPFHHGHPNLRDEVKVQGVLKRRDPPASRTSTTRSGGRSSNSRRSGNSKTPTSYSPPIMASPWGDTD